MLYSVSCVRSKIEYFKNVIDFREAPFRGCVYVCFLNFRNCFVSSFKRLARPCLNYAQ